MTFKERQSAVKITLGFLKDIVAIIRMNYAQKARFADLGSMLNPAFSAFAGKATSQWSHCQALTSDATCSMVDFGNRVWAKIQGLPSPLINTSRSQ